MSKLPRPNRYSRKDPKGKRYLITQVKQKTGLTERQARAAVQATLYTILETLGEGREMNITPVGSFTFKVRKGRTRPTQILRTGQFNCNVTIPATQKASIYVKFKQSQLLKILLNEKPEIASARLAARTKTRTHARLLKETLVARKAHDIPVRDECANVPEDPNGTQNGSLQNCQSGPEIVGDAGKAEEGINPAAPAAAGDAGA